MWGAVLVASAGAAAQDAAGGEKVFAKCNVCHQIGEKAKNFVGPVLNGVVGRKAGAYPGYNYSEANKYSGITRDEATLQAQRSPHFFEGQNATGGWRFAATSLV